jgi:hypothetical protein
MFALMSAWARLVAAVHFDFGLVHFWERVYVFGMDEGLVVLLHRANKAIAESRRLSAENRALALETRQWLRRLKWLRQELDLAKQSLRSPHLPNSQPSTNSRVPPISGPMS